MITVFTATYNRADTLPRLYDSLLQQISKDFEWLIVDDGSTDNTEYLVKEWIDEGKISVTYFKQENGGKHRAINKGVDLANGVLFFIVDSDDYLPMNSLMLVENYYSQIKNNDEFIGVVGFNAYPDGELMGQNMFPEAITDSNLIERREKFGVKADMAKVLITEKFRSFKFPDIIGEKFVAESLVWNRMAIQYKFRYFNEVIYIAEYMEGGLSNNSIRNRRKNPKYTTLLYQELSKNPMAPLKLRFRALINFWRFALCKSSNIFELLKEVHFSMLAVIALPLGVVLSFKDRFMQDVNIKKIK